LEAWHTVFGLRLAEVKLLIITLDLDNLNPKYIGINMSNLNFLDKLYYVFYSPIKRGFAHSERASFLMSFSIAF